jgi:hypothetical protein
MPTPADILRRLSALDLEPAKLKEVLAILADAAGEPVAADPAQVLADRRRRDRERQARRRAQNGGPSCQ